MKTERKVRGLPGVKQNGGISSGREWAQGCHWLISVCAIALVLIRPKGWPEAWWAASGACLLMLCRLISRSSAGRAIGKGLDIHLFLIGMMIM